VRFHRLHTVFDLRSPPGGRLPFFDGSRRLGDASQVRREAPQGPFEDPRQAMARGSRACGARLQAAPV
jgi:hypothetical protein